MLRIRFDAQISVNPLGEKFGCNPDTEALELIILSKSLGLNVGFDLNILIMEIYLVVSN